MASLARRIRRLGVRTQGRPERAFLDARVVGLRKICGQCETNRRLHLPRLGFLLAGALVFCVWPHVQAHGRDFAFCFIVTGFLAAPTIRTIQHFRARTFTHRKNPALPARDWLLPDDTYCPKKCVLVIGLPALSVSPG